jgi:hypothetical protein
MAETREDQQIAATKPPPTESDVFGALRQCFDSAAASRVSASWTWG